ncbi:hypothetical protein AX15_002114 [Amanita polypyramis BW_CC]|nr:hypothetical protein AX15_002114 [Amanita polypyramis BW_CC]
MPQAPAFSRLQLAAALLEYDNDLSDPNTPVRRAQDSAIFAHFRRNPAARPQLSSRRSDYLGVSIPSEAGSHGGRESALENRRSRASRGSLDALRNPFGHDDHWSEEEEGNEEELEVDLASWGLDALIPKDKGKSTKGKAKAATLPLHPVSSVRSHIPLTNNGNPTAVPRRAINTSRSVSLGGIAEHPGLNDELLEAAKNRRRSFGSPLDLVNMELSQLPLQRPRSLSYSAAQPLPSASQTVPFPSSSARSPSPYPVEEAYDRQVPVGFNFVDRRRLSHVSTDSKMLLQDDRTRRMSSGTVELVATDNPFAIRPPSPSRLSRFDPKATEHTRTFSNVSRGSRILPDQDVIPIDSQDQPKRERKYSTTLELLRPKILVMPSPLQPATPEAQNQVRNGFMLSTDGPPLPPGARSTRRNSIISVLDASNKPPIASNSFTPNPLMNLSLSQMTFRNTLHIGGQSDPYSETIGGLPRAIQEGEQVQFDTPEIKANDNLPLPGGSAGAALEQFRPPGKLFGKSLIDNLELRKAQMRSKQRVFTGDQRPSMMSRGSTFIDPLSLNSRPTAQRQSSFGIPSSNQALSKRNSQNAKPLLNFDDEEGKFKRSTSTRMASARSVFGVDTLWEREMAKLREIEAQEEKTVEEQRKRMEQEKPSGKKNKGKKKSQQEPLDNQLNVEVPRVSATETRVSVEVPVLPDIKRASRPPPKTMDEESDDDAGLVTNTRANDDTGKWFSDSDEEGPQRTTGTGPRYLNKVRQAPKPEEPDSEEDLPLSAAASRAVQRATRIQLADDSDEEKPLSSLLQKTKPIIPSIPPIKLDRPVNRNDPEDDDDQPLGLRASSIAHRSPQTGDDDDDRPLAFHPEQQRRTQYQMMAQQQQHQQQLMMQAQFQNSMFFNPPTILGSGFFGPPIVAPPMMMPPPIPAPSPPPVQDVAKYGRVDKWRHDVAVEGSR